MMTASAFIGASSADTLPTHRIPTVRAVEAASETIAACARQGYCETAVVLDLHGVTIVALRGDGAGVHTLDSAHDSVPLKTTPSPWLNARKARTRSCRSPS
jgi:hypothetical protein